jgi:UMF1 family MFS transporter
VDIPALAIRGLSATSLYGYTLGLSALLVLLTSPLLGAIADRTASKKRFLMVFCAVGSAASLAMAAIGPGDVWLALGLFLVANIGFVSGNVFYDSFLPHIAPLEQRDEVSGRGYAYGYLGGGLLFVADLLLVQFHAQLGIADAGVAIRIALGAVGLWWGGFSLITFRRLREAPASAPAPPLRALFGEGFGRLARTLRAIRPLRGLLLFLAAFMIYNDGIQTVIAMATIYGSEELGFDTLTLMGCLLMIQFVGIAGARLFARLATRIGAKGAVLLSLAVWAGVALYAFAMTRAVEFWILGGVVGLVLGGSQALSRSLYSRIIPPSASAEFFGFFSVFEKFSAIGGPILFAAIRQVSGSARLSILSLAAFFLVGGVLLAFVNVRRAEADRDTLEAQLAADES